MSNERVVSESYESMYKNAVRQLEEQEKTIETLKKDLREATAMADYFEKEKEIELRYLKGVIDGLKFSIRCNGVSGAEIQ